MFESKGHQIKLYFVTHALLLLLKNNERDKSTGVEFRGWLCKSTRTLNFKVYVSL